MKELEFILTYNGTATTLTHTPVGWNAFSVNCARDMMDFFGMVRTYNAKIQFVKEGADIVRTAIYTDGLKADVSLTIQKRNVHTNLFETKFTGKLIFGEFKDDKKNNTFECGVIEGGIFADVKNKMDTKWNVPSSAVTLLKYNGIASTFETVNCLQREQGYPWYNESTIPPPGSATLANPLPFTFKENDFADYQGGYLAFHNYTTDFSDAYNPVPVASTIYPIEILKDCKINIGVRPSQVTCYASATGGGWVTLTLTYRIYKVGSPDTIVHQWGTTVFSINDNEPFVTLQAPNTEYNTGEFAVVAGEKYYVALNRLFKDENGNVSQPGDVQFWINWDAAISMNVVITAPLPEENFKCITAMDLFTQIGIALGNYPVKSDFLTNYRSTSHGTVATGNELVFFNGWAVGKIATREDFILVTLRQFIKALRVFENCGFGIETIAGVDTLVIEPLEYWLNNTNMMNLPDIAQVETTLATELIHSEISVGYQKYEYNDNFGLDEFNGTLNFKTPETNITKTLDLISPIRADGAGIDYIRKLRLDKIYKTKIAQNNRDVNFDNDLFCVYARWDTYSAPTTYYKTIDNSIDLASTPTGTAYPLNQVNYYLSPKRCLKRNGGFIKSFLWGYSSEALQFLTTENNPDVVSQLTAETVAVTETSNETISGLNTALFHPVYITISIPGTFSIVDFLSVYSSGLFTFTYNGDLYKGILVEAEINMAYNQTSTIKLLSHISNDLTKLI